MKLQELLTEAMNSYQKFKQLDTNDFQKRGAAEPRNNIPTSVSVNVPANEITLSFVRTNEKTAKSIAIQYAVTYGIPYTRINVKQVGEYRNDNVTATISLN